MPALRDLLGRASVAVAAVACAVGAGNPLPAGAADPLQGKAETCAACHGPGGHSSMAEVPSLAGQPAHYLSLQLTLFRNKQRVSSRMSPIAANLSDGEIQELGAYFAALPPAEPPDGRDAGQAREGERLAQADQCAACHLATYAGQNQAPRLAGQREDYLLKAMKDYREGKRAGLDGTMTQVLRGVSDADLADLAQYLSRLR